MMKGKISLHRWLHNDKIMIVFSLVAAIVIWWIVASGPNNITTQEIDITVPITLSNSLAQENNLRVIGNETEVKVRVTVQGARWVVGQLKELENIQVRANTSNIINPGYHEVDLTATSVDNGNYEIISWEPQRITVYCDTWQKAEFAVSADISAVTLAKEQADKRYQLGEARFDTEVLPDGLVTVEGPKTEISQIASVVAVVPEKTIAETTIFNDVVLKAYDSNGNEVGVHCKFSATMVNITVPVQEYREVDIQYSVANIPEAFKGVANFITVSPQTVGLLGTPSAVQEFAASLQTFVVDFDNLDLDALLESNGQIRIPLNPPESVKILGDAKELVITLNLDGLSSKKMDLTLNGSNVTILNPPPGKMPTYSRIKLTGITLVGSTSSINRIEESDLKLVIDMAGAKIDGPTPFQARIQIEGYSDVWVYYGTDQHGVDVWLDKA